MRDDLVATYLAEGARAYARVTSLSEGRPRADRALYVALSTRFEHWTGAPDYLRKVRFPGLAAADPVRAFLREIESAVGGVSGN